MFKVFSANIPERSSVKFCEGYFSRLALVNISETDHWPWPSQSKKPPEGGFLFSVGVYEDGLC